MRKLFTILISLMLITACERQKTSSPQNYLHVIDLDKTKPEILLSELFESVTPIALETTEESLIGRIDKIIVTDEYIMVFDLWIAKSLLLFKRDGSFVRKIGHKGGGPGEYSSISDFCYDNTTGTVYVLDHNSNRVYLYNIHTNSFLKSIQLSDNGISRHVYHQNGELYTDLSAFKNKNEQYLLNRRNQVTGSIEEAWLDLETYSKNIDLIGGSPFLFGKPFLFGDGNSFKFNTTFMEGIMSFEKGKITPFLAFTPKYTLNMNDLKKVDIINIESVLDLDKTNKVFNITYYFEHKDLIFLNFWHGSFQKTLVYNQKTRDSRHVNEFNDLIYKGKNSDFRQDFEFIAQDNNGLFGRSPDVRTIKELLENNLISDNFKNAAIELSKLEEDANPILLYYKFKD